MSAWFGVRPSWFLNIELSQEKKLDEICNFLVQVLLLQTVCAMNCYWNSSWMWGFQRSCAVSARWQHGSAQLRSASQMTEEEELRTQCTARLTRVVSASFSPLIPSSVETCERSAAEPFCFPLSIYSESELGAIKTSLSGSGGQTVQLLPNIGL